MKKVNPETYRKRHEALIEKCRNRGLTESDVYQMEAIKDSFRKDLMKTYKGLAEERLRIIERDLSHCFGEDDYFYNMVEKVEEAIELTEKKMEKKMDKKFIEIRTSAEGSTVYYRRPEEIESARKVLERPIMVADNGAYIEDKSVEPHIVFFVYFRNKSEIATTDPETIARLEEFLNS